MKRIRVWVAIAMTMVILSSAVMSGAALSVGDVNDNGAYDMRDVLLLYRAVAGQKEADVPQTVCGDLDHDGALSMRDVQRMYKIVLGVSESAEQDLPFEATYVDAAMGATIETPAVITTAAEWQAFQNDYLGAYQPFCIFW